MNKIFLDNGMLIFAGCLISAVIFSASSSWAGERFPVSGRDFPISKEVDVLVVGGTSGGVAAAVAAAENGSKVFLMAQRPYLGEDICGTYRMWPDRSDFPLKGLAADVFQSPQIAAYKHQPFSYEADVLSSGKHKDTSVPSMLTNGKWFSIEKDTVQYDSNVNIVAELSEVTQVDRIKISSFQRPGKYCALFVTVYVSNDGQHWEKAAVQKDTEYVRRLHVFSIDINREAKFVKFQIDLAPQVPRMLISEIEILTAQSQVSDPANPYPPTPLHVKRTLDDALLGAGVEFLYGCFPTDVLTDGSGAVRGVVMANRAGRQVVMANTIIDATPTAMIARLAGVEFRAGSRKTEYIHTIVSPHQQAVDGVEVRHTPTDIYHQGELYPAQEYRVALDLDPKDMSAFAEAQQEVLDKVWTRGQLSASETLFFVPEESAESRAPFAGESVAGGVFPVYAFEPKSVSGLFLLNGYADISRGCAEKMLRPVQYIKAGEQLGAAVSARKVVPGSGGQLLAVNTFSGELPAAQLRETLAPIRPEVPAKQRVTIGKVSYPVLGTFDVVVVGGGTSGGPAAIGAARKGAKTLVVEYQAGLGGVGTVGLIGRYWKGFKDGFTKEMDEGVAALRPADAPAINGWDIYDKMEWYRRELRKAGAEMWMRSMAWGAVVQAGDVQGVAVSTPFGSGVVLADVVIDSTGNGDIAIAAGADYDYLGESRMGIQGTGLPTFNLGDHYNNSDFTVSYESDVVDAWQLRVVGKSEYRTGDAYDVASLIDTRERRRVLGDYYLTVLDQLMGRIYPDSVEHAFSDYDCHGVNYNPYSFLQPNPGPTACYVPYRCMLPSGLDGILTTGMGISVHHDALPLIRMQADLQNQGYAIGVAAAMAAEQRVAPRSIDVRALQQHLVKMGCLPAEVLTGEDPYPFSKERIKLAVERAPSEYGGKKGLECSILLAHGDIARPFLRDAYDQAEGREKLFYAHILAVLEDAYGLETIQDYLAARLWDKGRPKPTSKMGDMDRLIIAAGRPADRRVTGVLIEKIDQLNASMNFSHFRAVALAADRLRDPALAPALAALLEKPGMSGYACHTVDAVKEADAAAMKKLGPEARSVFSFQPRIDAIRELSLARALYRCGDHNGLGRKILESYCSDLHGVYAAHARQVLAE